MSTNLRLTISIALTLYALVIPTVKVLAQPATNQSYAWAGEVVMYDEKGKTVTVRAPYLEHINRYIGEFTRGDKVVLNWATPRPGGQFPNRSRSASDRGGSQRHARLRDR